MSNVMEVETERLRLRHWRASDRKPFAELNSDPRVMEFLPSVIKRSESDAMADRCQALIEDRGWGFWAVERKDSGEFIGFTGLHVPSAPLPFQPCVEVGWRLGFLHWGQGFATEAARKALEIGFDHLQLPEIVSFTSVGNVRSRAVMDRLGMIESTRFEHPTLPEGHPLRLHILYRIQRRC
jgi:RimJ/RimL family protein N-acetyltransferase